MKVAQSHLLARFGKFYVVPGGLSPGRVYKVQFLVVTYVTHTRGKLFPARGIYVAGRLLAVPPAAHVATRIMIRSPPWKITVPTRPRLTRRLGGDSGRFSITITASGAFLDNRDHGIASRRFESLRGKN